MSPLSPNTSGIPSSRQSAAECQPPPRGGRLQASSTEAPQVVSVSQCAGNHRLPLPKLRILASRKSLSESRPTSPSAAAQDASLPLRLPAVPHGTTARAKVAPGPQDGASDCRLGLLQHSPVPSPAALQSPSGPASAPQHFAPLKMNHSAPAPAPHTPNCSSCATGRQFASVCNAISVSGALGGAAAPAGILRTASHPQPVLLAAVAEAAEEAEAAGGSSRLRFASHGGRPVALGSLRPPGTPDKSADRGAVSAPVAALSTASAEAEAAAFVPPRRHSPSRLRAGAEGADAAAAGAARGPAGAEGPPSGDVEPPVLLATSPATPPSMERSVWRLDDYAFVSRRYKGPVSAVYKARCQRSGMTVALKVYSLEAVPSNTLHLLIREIQIHSALVHPHIAALYGAFQEGVYLVLVQEWAARGDLHSVHRARGRPLGEEQLVQVVLAPFLAALAHIHGRGVCHRDIKPENIFFTADWRLLVADFGASIDLARERAVTRTGTLDYMAPEVSRCPIKSQAAENKERTDLAYTYAADIWSTGILAYELLLGFPPFADGVSAAAAAAAAAASGGEAVAAAAAAAAAGAEPSSLRLVLPPPLPRSLSAGARDFIRSALAADPAERPTAAQLLRHPWITGLTGDTASSPAAGAPQAAAPAAAAR